MLFLLFIIFPHFPSQSHFFNNPILKTMDLHVLSFSTIVLLFSIFVLVFFSHKSNKSKSLNLPPGPPGWPIVGNLFQVARSGKPFFQYVDDLLPKYGPIFTLKMGSRTLIILTDAKLVHEALIQRGPLFATRPPENPTRKIFSCNKFTVNAAVYGPVWRSLRRNMVQNMLSSSRIKEFWTVRDSAMDKLMDRIRTEAESNNDGAVWVLRNARFAVFCILLGMCFGLEMDEKTVIKMDQVMKSVLMVLDPRIDDFLPILGPFFAEQRRKVQQVRKQQLDFIVPLIERRRKALKNPGSDPNAMSFSYLDTLFELKIEGRESSSPSDAELVSLISEFINGGTDTTATAVEWGIAQLIDNPEVQQKLYEEIKNVVGNRTVSENDVDKMEYLQAVVKELLRKHPPTFFLLTHAVTEPTKLGGYDIPTNANVEIFSNAIADDPKIWSDPKKFDPGRFFSGKEEADITGVTQVKMTPFGVGRRICPGLGLATVHLHLMIARMVQEFEWCAYPCDKKLDFTAKFEFTVVMKNTLRAIIKPRA